MEILLSFGHQLICEELSVIGLSSFKVSSFKEMASSILLASLIPVRGQHEYKKI
jgi:hypothetical protein